jgi:fucose permease
MPAKKQIVCYTIGWTALVLIAVAIFNPSGLARALIYGAAFCAFTAALFWSELSDKGD